MPTIYDTTPAALRTPERFPRGRTAPGCALPASVAIRSRAKVAALFPERYLYLPALGTQACATGTAQDPRLWQPYTQLIDWRRGVQAVAQTAPTTDIVIMCTCIERFHRSHRRQVATSLARALGFTLAATYPRRRSLMLDAVKIHKSRGAYEELVALGQGYWRKGLADTEEGGIRLAVAKHPDITQRFIDGPKYPQWPYLSVLKQATGFGKQEDFTQACINTAMRLNPAFARQVATR